MTTPVGLRVGFWFALLLSFGLAAAFALTAAGILPYKIAGQTVSREAWWRISPILPIVSADALAIAFGIRRRRPWTRHLVMLLWPTLAVAAFVSYRRGDIPGSVLVRALVEPAVLTVLCGWYFYRKPNVMEYFRGNPRRGSGVFSGDEGSPRT
jgi:peptidoglycan/LPS O-acetylase OafA/YrhL